MSRYEHSLRKPVHFHFTDFFDFFAGYPVFTDILEGTKACH